MPEQYGIAAWRHLSTGEKLLAAGSIDDAGYHFGICSENAIKHALQISGVEREWNRLKVDPKSTPMRAHFPTMKALIRKAATHIAIYASGRVGGVMRAYVITNAFDTKLNAWHINIRYADTAHPVSAPLCLGWQIEAEDLLLNLVI